MLKISKKSIQEKTGNFRDHLIEALKQPEKALAYLQVALEEYQEDGDTDFFLTALRDITEARGGVGSLAKQTKLNRQNLYNALSEKGNPRLSSLSTILKMLGFQLSVNLVHS